IPVLHEELRTPLQCFFLSALMVRHEPRGEHSHVGNIGNEVGHLLRRVQICLRFLAQGCCDESSIRVVYSRTPQEILQLLRNTQKMGEKSASTEPVSVLQHVLG